MPTTTSSFPPEVVTSFTELFLSYPVPLDDNEEDILGILNWVMITKAHKLTKCPNKQKQCIKLEKEIRELYEQIKEKKDYKTETKNLTERPFYRFDCAKGSHEKLLQRLKYKVRTGSRRR